MTACPRELAKLIYFLVVKTWVDLRSRAIACAKPLGLSVRAKNDAANAEVGSVVGGGKPEAEGRKGGLALIRLSIARHVKLKYK